MGDRETSIPVATRVTASLSRDIDRLAVELGLTRGNAVTLLLAAAVNRQDELLATYRTLITSARERR